MKAERQISAKAFVEGPKALRNFTETMKALFRVRKTEIESGIAKNKAKMKKAGS